MKNIKELGLELIDLEDQVLLVDKKLGIKHIASTKPMEGIPLLVIEDNVIGKPLDDYIRTKANQDQCVGFIEGYNKAKEIYKFTEQDLRKAFMYALCQEKAFEEVIEGLTKKELWIEVEFKETKSSVFRENDSAPYGKYEPKIINNQIKGIYK